MQMVPILLLVLFRIITILSIVYVVIVAYIILTDSDCVVVVHREVVRQKYYSVFSLHSCFDTRCCSRSFDDVIVPVMSFSTNQSLPFVAGCDVIDYCTDRSECALIDQSQLFVEMN